MFANRFDRMPQPGHDEAGRAVPISQVLGRLLVRYDLTEPELVEPASWADEPGGGWVLQGVAVLAD